MKKRLMAFILIVALLWCSVPVLSLAVDTENADESLASQTEKLNETESKTSEPEEPNEPGEPTAEAEVSSSAVSSVEGEGTPTPAPSPGYQSPESEGEESQADSAWDRFCKWWTDGWQCLCNWFRGVFTKWKFDCWITNEEWDARFPAEGTAE